MFAVYGLGIWLGGIEAAGGVVGFVVVVVSGTMPILLEGKISFMTFSIVLTACPQLFAW